MPFFDFRPNLKNISKLSALFLLIYLLSYLGFLYPFINTFVFWLIIGIFIVTGFYKIEYGLLILLGELFIGSKGYLFSFSIANFVVSLRLALFILLFLFWFYYKFKKRNIRFLKTNLLIPFVTFSLFLIVGVITGLIKNNPQVLFFDFNAYLYFALILIIFDLILEKGQIKRIWLVFTAAVLALSLFTLFVLTDFGLIIYNPNLAKATQIEEEQLKKLEELSTIPENARLAQTTKIAREKLKLNWGEITEDKSTLYRWLKDSGVAEVSYIGGRFFRVFSPSQFFVVIFSITLLAYFFHKKFIFFARGNLLLIILFLLSLATTLISFSRSFWLGLIAAFIFLLFGLPAKRIVKIICFVVILLIFLTILIYFVNNPITQILKERVTSFFNPTSELAATNRMSMLNPILEKIKENPIIGSGFGTLITFKALIPGTDIVEYIKVYIYEWAYLDIIVKIGILGLFSYLLLIGAIIRNGYYSLKNNDEIETRIFIRGMLAGLIFLLVVHLTTPFLNHPLGIGYLIICSAIFWLFKNKQIKSVDL
jgi:hypothetical protein